MNRILTGLLCIAFFHASAQESILDSINTKSFTGIYQAGEMGEFIYVPYFSIDKEAKKNFIIKQLNGESLNTEGEVAIEIPTSYKLQTSAFNGSAYLLYFYDKNKKEDVLITLGVDGVVKKRITTKASSERVIPMAGSEPESFVIVRVSKKGSYKISKTNINLEPAWEKSFKPTAGSWTVVNVNNSIEGLSITRKENLGNNQYKFTVHTIQPDQGETISEAQIKQGDITGYPNFFHNSQGMGFCGGVYYKNGTYNSKNPDGIFGAMLSPDGSIEQMMNVPYSQLIEDVKNSVGSELAKANAGIVFSKGMFAPDIDGAIMVGEVYRVDKNEDKGGKVYLKDFIVIQFGREGKYKKATVIKSPQRVLTLNGDLSTTNNIDIANWLVNSSLTKFQYFLANMPYAFGFITDKDEVDNICFHGTLKVADTIPPACFEIAQMKQGANKTYKFSKGSLKNNNPKQFGIVPNPMSFEKVTTYELAHNMVFFRKIPAPDLEEFMVVIEPEEPEEEEPQEEEEEMEEEEPEEEEPKEEPN